MKEIDHSQNNKEKREGLFILLYKKAFPAVAKHVSRMGGSFEEAKDIFQDALIIYYEKIHTASVFINKSDDAYILGIAKHLWYKKYRESMWVQTLDKADTPIEVAAEEFSAPSSGKLIQLLGTTGQKCMEILRAFYYNNLPVAEIANVFGYSGVRSATVQKYKCLEKVRDNVKEKSLIYEDFLE